MLSSLRRSRDHQPDFHSRDLRRPGLPGALRPSAEPKKALSRVTREAYLVFPTNVQGSILNDQLNIEHYGCSRFTCKRNGSAIAAEMFMNNVGGQLATDFSLESEY